MPAPEPLRPIVDAARRVPTWLGPMSAKRWFRLAVPLVAVIVHLILFAHAGHSRIDRPFNNAPGEPPEFGNPDAPALRIFPREPHNWSRLVVSRWDAQHYIGTAVRGLSACPTDPSKANDGDYLDCGLGWLPAYGMVGAVVTKVSGLPDDYALVLVSILCTLALGYLWTSAPIVKRLGRLEAYVSLLAFHVFPTAFYLVTPYTEAMTLLLVFGALVALTKQRWVTAGLLVGGATALRTSAVAFSAALGAAALAAMWRAKKAGKPKWWRPALAIPLSGWGQLATMLYLKVAVGDFTAFWRARHAFGDKQDFSRLDSSTYFLQGFGSQHVDMVMYTGLIGIMVLCGREVLKKFKEPEAVYLLVASVATLAMTVVAPLHYWGINRYLLLTPLAFLSLGTMARKHTALFCLWLVLCMMFYWHVEMCSYVAQGNPQICPCLGKYEFGMPF